MRQLHTISEFETGRAVVWRGCGLEIFLFAKELGMAKNKVKHYLINLSFKNEIIFFQESLWKLQTCPKEDNKHFLKEGLSTIRFLLQHTGTVV